MTNDDLERQAQLIASSQQAFVDTVRNLSELVDSLIKHQSSLMGYLNSWRNLFVSTRDLMQEQVELHRDSLEALKALSKALSETAVSTNESNERIERLIVKVENYFGTGEGLDYEN